MSPVQASENPFCRDHLVWQKRVATWLGLDLARTLSVASEGDGRYGPMALVIEATEQMAVARGLIDSRTARLTPDLHIFTMRVVLTPDESQALVGECGAEPDFREYAAPWRPEGTAT